MPTAPICARCDKTVSGAAIVADGRTWHPYHLVCSICNEVIPAYRVIFHNGSPFHRLCAEAKLVSRCILCRKPTTEGGRVDSLGNTYCLSHAAAPQCAWCWRRVDSSPAHADTVRALCDVCTRTGVRDVVMVSGIQKRVLAWLKSQGFELSQAGYSVEFAHPLKGEPENDLRMGFMRAHHASGVVWVEGISIRLGLPQPLLERVMVHELVHVWLIERGILCQHDWAMEGLCEYVAFRFVSSLKAIDYEFIARNIEQRRDPVYGRGFQRISALASGQGLNRFVFRILSTQRLP